MSSATAVDSSMGDKQYEVLPEAVKGVVSRKEYAWLSDAEKARLERELTEPEWQ